METEGLGFNGRDVYLVYVGDTMCTGPKVLSGFIFGAAIATVQTSAATMDCRTGSLLKPEFLEESRSCLPLGGDTLTTNADKMRLVALGPKVRISTTFCRL